MDGVTQLVVAHTADLSAAEVAGVRTLLGAAFKGRFDDDDWEHSVGGLHVVLADGDQLVGHAAVVQRRLLLDDRSLRAGYVEAVAVDPGRQGQGLGAQLMAEAERIVRGGYDLGALSAADRVEGFYTGRGWRRWAGPTGVMAPTGIVRTPDEDGTTYVLADWSDLTGRLACDWRPGDVW
jgi:aminoglycoside 2'-N-acetyltransferase I